MHTLTLRIYLSVVAVLASFAVASGWIVQRHIEQEKQKADSVLVDRTSAWGDLIQRSLPPVTAPPEVQADALKDWSTRLRVPLALDDVRGERIAASESFLHREDNVDARKSSIPLDDGRRLWVIRPKIPGLGPPHGPPHGFPFLPPFLLQSGGVGLIAVLVMLFVAVAAGAWPVARHLTRRLKALKKGVEQFGAGELHHRVEVSGRDEVAAVATSFNFAAERIEALVRSHQSLLANASHELRSPLARMKMAVSMLGGSPPERQAHLMREIDTNVAELDALVEEVLLASRLDATDRIGRRDPVDLLALAAEEAARVEAVVQGDPVTIPGEERLLRRALRNLLENARRYGGGDVSVVVHAVGGQAVVQVCDRGAGVPADLRDRIFEPFYRLPGHAEHAGGVGLGLSLVKQIAERHGGQVRCTGRDGGGSCFELSFPTA